MRAAATQLIMVQYYIMPRKNALVIQKVRVGKAALFSRKNATHVDKVTQANADSRRFWVKKLRTIMLESRTETVGPVGDELYKPV